MKFAPLIAAVMQKGGPSALWQVFTLFVPTLLIMAVSCKSRERFIDDARRFSALSGPGYFQLDTVDAQVKRIVVNFFAPDCPPCEKEIPALKAFYAAHAADSDLLFISIGSSLKAIDSQMGALTDIELRAEVKNFATKYALPYPQYIASSSDLRSWRVTGFPETFVFERSVSGWKLRRKFISEVSREVLENELR